MASAWISDLIGTLKTTFSVGKGSFVTSSMTAARTITFADRSGTVAFLNAIQSWSRGQAGAISTVTDASTVSIDFSLANNFSLTIGGNRTVATPSNLVAGQSGVITITQDATGGRTLAYSSSWKFPGGTAPVLSTAANAVDELWYYVETTGRVNAVLLKDVK